MAKVLSENQARFIRHVRDCGYTEGEPFRVDEIFRTCTYTMQPICVALCRAALVKKDGNGFVRLCPGAFEALDSYAKGKS